MIICDFCYCKNEGEVENTCNITHKNLEYIEGVGIAVENKDCPLDHVKLKNGVVRFPIKNNMVRIKDDRKS